ncbi:MAG: V-type ATP synthase subunit E [bacterium]
MGSEELFEKILDDARLKVVLIQEEKARQQAEIEARTKSTIEKLRQESTVRLNERIREMVDRARSQAKLEGRKIVLKAKWQVIDFVCSEAKKVILNSPDYPAIIMNLAKKYASTDSSVHLSFDDTKRLGTVDNIKVEPVSVSGGLVVRKGKELIDLSLDTMLTLVRRELSSELAALLFEGKDKG